MKHLLKFTSAALLLISLSATLNAKMVKFIVNMKGHEISPNLVHVVGDFQDEAGFPGGDWNSTSTPLTQELGDTNLYSIVVNIPAFTKYEYKFANGDQFYEVEFVPIESRVGYNFNDNRWIYIDSLAADTQVVGPLRFSGNAPMGQYLVRFLVDMHEEPSVSPLGVHVAGQFQGLDPAKTRMYSFGGAVWEHIGYVDSIVAGTNFVYYNGNTVGDVETLPGACDVFGYRSMGVPNDTVLPVVCFKSCDPCLTVSVAQAWESKLSIYPNPAHESAFIRLDNYFDAWSLVVRDMEGKLLRSVEGSGEQAIRLEQGDLKAGLYIVTVSDAQGHRSTQKLIFQ
jgi:hypothetical protein